MEKTKIFIAIPTTGTIRTELALFLLHLDKDYDTEVVFTFGGGISHNRNLLIEHFLQMDYEWFLFFDSDIMPPFNILEMTKNGKNICSGVYYQWQEESKKLIPLVLQIKNNHYRVFDETCETDVVEVDGVGAGCLLINRKVFEAVEKPYFMFGYNDKGLCNLGEDLYFCEKAIKAGFKIFVDRKMICDHYKTVTLKDVNEWRNKSMWWK